MFLAEDAKGSEQELRGEEAVEVAPATWRGLERGWCCLLGSPKPASGRHAFAARVEALPSDAVVRLGWQPADGTAGPFEGWSYYASPGSFGSQGWKAHAQGEQRQAWERYGSSFKAGDVLTAVVDRGALSFFCNSEPLGFAYQVPAHLSLRPFVALKRRAEVALRAAEAEIVDSFATPEQLREMAWSARLNRRGYMLVLFQVLFLCLVRPPATDGTPSWDILKREYDGRFGFPSPAKSEALARHFAEVHRVLALRSSEGWPLFFRMLGFGEISTKQIDRFLFAAYERASRLNYRLGGRHDHA